MKIRYQFVCRYCGEKMGHKKNRDLAVTINDLSPEARELVEAGKPIEIRSNNFCKGCHDAGSAHAQGTGWKGNRPAMVGKRRA